MYFVKLDVASKLSKIEEAYKSNEKGKTITQLIDNEIADNEHKNLKSGTKNILPLARAFEFIHLFLDNLAKTDEELSSCARKVFKFDFHLIELGLWKFYFKISRILN